MEEVFGRGGRGGRWRKDIWFGNGYKGGVIRSIISVGVGIMAVEVTLNFAVIVSYFYL